MKNFLDVAFFYKLSKTDFWKSSAIADMSNNVTKSTASNTNDNSTEVVIEEKSH